MKIGGECEKSYSTYHRAINGSLRGLGITICTAFSFRFGIMIYLFRFCFLLIWFRFSFDFYLRIELCQLFPFSEIDQL